MNYEAVEVIWIFRVDGRADGTEIEGSIRGPRGPKKTSCADFLASRTELRNRMKGVNLKRCSWPQTAETMKDTSTSRSKGATEAMPNLMSVWKGEHIW